MEFIIKPNEKAVIESLAEVIEDCASAALSERNVFRIGLSGGSVLNYLCEAIPQSKSDLSKWRLFFCDERFVEQNDEESTFGAYKEKLLPKAQLQEKQFFAINTNLTLAECAKDYEQRILKEFQMQKGDVPVFDLLLLGMGPDGHTCSLFPAHALLQESKLLIAPIADSPKPPPKRITMTLPLINNARCCVFAMCGAGKAEMAKRVFKDKEALPAALVAPKQGRLIGIFDEAAGVHLK